tara:strand:+ start:104 stop:418 length:315 start_codon:yes stop_codon:yes gene_type:complete
MINIGFIGTGLMGLPMAKNIFKSGYKLIVYNRSKEKLEPLKKCGVQIGSSIGNLVSSCEVVITMLTDDKAVDGVIGSKEFIDNLKAGSTVVDMSSTKPTTAITR